MTNPTTRTRAMPKSARLTDSKAFIELLKGRRKASGCLEIAIRGRRVGSEGIDAVDVDTGARLGIVVGRKNLLRAVDRNALKRIVREAFRQRREELPPREMLVRLRQRLTGVPRMEIRARVKEAIRTLFDQART